MTNEQALVVQRRMQIEQLKKRKAWLERNREVYANCLKKLKAERAPYSLLPEDQESEGLKTLLETQCLMVELQISNFDEELTEIVAILERENSLIKPAAIQPRGKF